MAVCWKAFTPPQTRQRTTTTPNNSQGSQGASTRPGLSEISPSVLGLTTKKKKKRVIPSTAPTTRSLGRHDSMEEVRTLMSSAFGKASNRVKSSSLPPKSTTKNSPESPPTQSKPKSNQLTTSNQLNTSFPDDEWDEELVLLTQKVEDGLRSSSHESEDKNKKTIMETPKRISLGRASKQESPYGRPQPQKQLPGQSRLGTSTTPLMKRPNPILNKRKPSLSVKGKEGTLTTRGSINTTTTKNVLNTSMTDSDIDISLFEKSHVESDNKSFDTPSHPKYRKTGFVAGGKTSTSTSTTTPRNSKPEQPRSKRPETGGNGGKKVSIVKQNLVKQNIVVGEMDDDEDDSFLSQLDC